MKHISFNPTFAARRDKYREGRCGERMFEGQVCRSDATGLWAMEMLKQQVDL